MQDYQMPLNNITASCSKYGQACKTVIEKAGVWSDSALNPRVLAMDGLTPAPMLVSMMPMLHAGLKTGAVSPAPWVHPHDKAGQAGQREWKAAHLTALAAGHLQQRGAWHPAAALPA